MHHKTQIKFKNTMLKSIPCNYKDAFILLKVTITVVGQRADAASIAAETNNNQVIFKNRAPFNDCISEINNTQVDNAKDLKL